jgi:hypothetical protein
MYGTRNLKINGIAPQGADIPETEKRRQSVRQAHVLSHKSVQLKKST